MGLIKHPDVFRCGFEWAGVTDIKLMYEVSWSDTGRQSLKYSMPKLIGDPVKDAEQLKATSPLLQADRLHQPLLMAHGSQDRRVPLVHGTKFYDAVRQHNPQVSWHVYADEGHSWNLESTRKDFWTKVEQFLATHL